MCVCVFVDFRGRIYTLLEKECLKVKEIFEKIEVESTGTAAPPCWADSHYVDVHTVHRRRKVKFQSFSL